MIIETRMAHFESPVAIRAARSKSSSQGLCVVQLLVASRKGTRRVLPKGVVEPDLSPAESAAKD